MRLLCDEGCLREDLEAREFSEITAPDSRAPACAASRGLPHFRCWMALVRCWMARLHAIISCGMGVGHLNPSAGWRRFCPSSTPLLGHLPLLLALLV
jgi:hypothetical protein